MLEKETEFIEKVKNLSAGEKATLRRNAGERISTADSDAIMLFYSLAPHDLSFNDDIWFYCACIESIWRDTEEKPVSFAETMGALIGSGKGSESTKKRFTNLLDARMDEDGSLQFKITRLIKYLKSFGYHIDTAQMIYDLSRWNSDDRYIQKEWAKKFYIGMKGNEEE